MERDARWQDIDWLTAALAAGRSIASIADEVGRDASTIGYWARKFGLTSEHATRHAAKGAIDADMLLGLVDAGHSVREIAEAVGRSESTVRYHLKRRGLTTKRAARSRLQREEGVCPSHGAVAFVLRSDGYRRCIKCRSEAVSRRRRRVKAILVQEAGGACAICGYDRYVGALQFHHRERAQKRFELSRAGVTMAIAVAREEVAKCVLVCANCHAEVEAGVASIPGAVQDDVPGECDPE